MAEISSLGDGLLEVSGLNVFYGPVQAAFDISFAVPEGQIVTLLGAKGAGKTTILRTLAGFVKPRSGTVRLGGHTLNGTPVEKRAARGMSLVADDRLLFPSLSVEENLKAGGYHLPRRDTKTQLELVLDCFPDLAARRHGRAGGLSGGQAQMLALGRALMSKPRLLLLDEPSQGLAPKIVADLFGMIRDISTRTKTTILLVEQNAALALELATYGYVLSMGRIELEGETADLARDGAIRRLYLGV